MADIDQLAARAVANPPARPQALAELAARVTRRRQRRRRLAGAAVGLARSGGGGDEDASVEASGSGDRVALDTLLDRPAGTGDAFPEDFATEWMWQPDDPNFPIYEDLDFTASRSVAFSDDVPAFAVPTESRDGVCLVYTYPPPDWFPDVDSVIPIRCADAATFNRDGITLRACGPHDRWVTMALVPVGLDPADVQRYGTLHPTGAAILFRGVGPGEPVGLEYASGRTVRLEGAPLGSQPEDGSVPCPSG